MVSNSSFRINTPPVQTVRVKAPASPYKNGQQQLLRGPRRVVRLCVFALLLPAMLITVPLYVRLVLYPPAHYPMMPTDQRLLGRHASSFWCQAQWTNMNGSYNAYLTNDVPPASLTRSTHHMLYSTTLQDDVKEYWGFHLLKGSTVTMATCSTMDGAQLMILRGVKNLHRCAWIGEKDSVEDGEETGGKSEEHPAKGVAEHFPFSEETKYDEISLQPKEVWKVINEVSPQGDDPEAGTPGTPTSEERQGQLEYLLRKAIRVSSSNKEIQRLLHMLQRSEDRPLPRHLQQRLAIMSGEGEDVPTPHKSRQSPDRDPKNMSPATRERRETRERPPAEDFNGGLEIFDEGEQGRAGRQSSAAGTSQSPVESLIGEQVFFPEGLRFERGKFNQTNNNDGSNEEHVSSYSSSEEALANCEGVIMTLPLATYRGCSYHWTELNKVVYDIPVTGTYYFVFSSDNEIAPNDLYFNLTLQRVTYDTQSAVQQCANTTQCSLPLAFWSDTHTLVEVPEERSWSNAYVLDTVCQPRVPVFLAFILAAPLLILLCAFQ
ncbi:hypothetical protein GWK47_008455 [Chionoecetes opilio]|uniref:E3 ubiquitin-protein ligase APD1-4 middle domain-containing protein n=1 Tax=Chionoecetes opilio TaxID=41210 RepID=A0A8J5C4Q6_CHIOP|nr:hypothetical protein GWK47_008455 [Chionoecetes opilio]